MSEWKTYLMYAAPIGVALASGKFLRRLILLPFEWVASRTSTKVDDVLVQEAESDLGLSKSTLKEAEDAPVEKR